MDEAGGDVGEREPGLFEERLDVPQRLLRLRLDPLGQLAGRRVAAALAGEEDPIAEIEPRRVRRARGADARLVISLLPIAL